MRSVAIGASVRGRLVVSMLVAAAGLASAAHAQTSFRMVARTGSAGVFGPGQGAGVLFDGGIDSPSLNQFGQVLFRGTVASTQGIYARWATDTTSSNVRQVNGGTAVPQTASGTGAAANFATSSAFNAAILSSRAVGGQAAYGFRIGSTTGAASDAGSGIQRLAFSGDAAPGAGGANFASSAVAGGNPYTGSNGHVLFLGTLAASTTSTPQTVTTVGSSNATGVWITDPSTNIPALVHRQNDDTGLGGGIRFATLTNTSLSVNGTGRFIGHSLLQNGTGFVSSVATTGTGQTIISNRGGSVQILARQGNAVVDETGAVSATDVYRTLTSSSDIGFNNAGHYTFEASRRNSVGGAQVGGTDMYADTGSGLRRIITSGGALPSISRARGSEFTGVNWGSSNDVTLGGGGHIGVVALGLTGTGVTVNVNSGAILRRETDATYTRVLRQGDVLLSQAANPGLPSDVAFSGLSGSSLSVNRWGEMLLLATLTGTNVNDVGFFNNTMLIGVDIFGNAVPLLRRGDLFDPGTRGGPLSIISIGIPSGNGGQDGRALGLNDNGEFVVQLDLGTYTTASSGPGTSSVTYTGLFVFQGIPAPGASVLLGLGGLLAARRRRD